MKKIKLPNPLIVTFGGLAAFWIANIINPGFNPIGVMMLMLVPVLIIEMLYPQPELEQLIKQAQHSIDNPAQKRPAPAELIDDKEADKTA